MQITAPTLLKVGELAHRAGLTVRTLHHYDRIGLLQPSARSDSGYRLYNRADIARLHQVQALQRLGLSLAEVATTLADPQAQLPHIIAQQLRMLGQQIEQSRKLQQRLEQLQTQLLQGDEPDLSDWLKTLELMNMYDRYFTPDELKRIPMIDGTRNQEWTAMVATVRQLMDSHTPPHSVAAQQAALQWFAMVERDSANDAALISRLTDVVLTEPTMQDHTGITPALVNYIQQASIQHKLDLYAKYLSPDELAYVRENYGKRINEWPKLIGAVYQAMKSDTPPHAPEVKQLARQWLDLFRSYAGDNPETHAKLRTAHEQEPGLLAGSMISPELLNYMRSIFMQLQEHAEQQNNP